MSQLDLPLALDDYATFSTFSADGNEAAVNAVRQVCDNGEGPGCWLWGQPGTGKSHLLQAVCAELSQRAAFLPLAELKAADPGILDGMEQLGVVCLDDVHAVCGDEAWERGLFRFFNQAIERGAALVVAASAVPSGLHFGLPDLASRFATLPPFRLRLLPDDALQSALIRRARHRGIELPEDTAHYLIMRERRDMVNLHALLDHLETEALSARRRLTVPFVRSILGNK